MESCAGLGIVHNLSLECRLQNILFFVIPMGRFSEGHLYGGMSSALLHLRDHSRSFFYYYFIKKACTTKCLLCLRFFFSLYKEVSPIYFVRQLAVMAFLMRPLAPSSRRVCSYYQVVSRVSQQCLVRSQLSRWQSLCSLVTLFINITDNQGPHSNR